MKFFFGLITITFLSSVFACDIPEAEFIGTVKNVTQVNSICTYNIDYFYFSSSNECPLVIGEASVALFQDPSCSLKNGDKVSGILERKDGQIIYYL